MRLFKLLILGAGAAYAYKRFFADPGAGAAETSAAQPFSSEQLGDDGVTAPAETAPAEQQTAAGEETKDTLERPTWLDPADAG